MTPQPPNPELAALPNLFLLNIENRALVDGKAPRAPLSATLLLFAVVLPVLAVAAILANAGPWMTYFQLKQSGQTSLAFVTDQKIEPQCVLLCADHYFISYSYPAAGETYTGSVEVDVTTYNGLFRGAIITVIYLPNAPDVSRIAGSELDAGLLPRGILTVVVTLAAVAALPAGVLHLHSTRDPRNRGRLLRGQVLAWEAQEMGDGKGQVRVELKYGFDTPEGRRIEHIQTMKMSSGKYQSSYFPRPDTPLAVLYVNDRLFEVL